MSIYLASIKIFQNYYYLYLVYFEALTFYLSGIMMIFELNQK